MNLEKYTKNDILYCYFLSLMVITIYIVNQYTKNIGILISSLANLDNNFFANE